jgi:hypothetical protein
MIYYNNHNQKKKKLLKKMGGKGLKKKNLALFLFYGLPIYISVVDSKLKLIVPPNVFKSAPAGTVNTTCTHT